MTVLPDRGESSTTAQALLTSPGELIMQNGPIGEEATELLEEFAGTHQHPQSTYPTAADQLDDSEDEWEGTPNWRKPSALWMLCLVPFSAMAQTSTLAPRIELFTLLACQAHKPDIFDSVASLGYESYGSGGLSPSLCASDPVVQAAVAKLAAAITTTMGVLSLLTTAWWGSLSDRKGRVKVLGISLFGLLTTDISYVVVYYFSSYLPGGYWFLLIGPFIEGTLGGFAAAAAAIHAYLADTTTESTRARVFSLNLGLVFVGLALGPTMASLAIKYTGQLISVFLAAATVHSIYACFIWIVLPESLSKKRMEASKKKHERETLEAAELLNSGNSAARRSLLRLRSAFQLFSPLMIFFPTVRPNANPLKKPKRDWSLTLMAVGYLFMISVMASYPFMFQYAAATFGWTSVKLGYYMSAVGTARALFLTVLLPLIIKIFKPEPLVIEIPPSSPPSETQPLLGTPKINNGSRSQGLKKELHSPSFELTIARASILIEIVTYILKAFAPSGGAFVVTGVIGAMGVGFSPAVQTCTLAMYARRGGTETGRLFGALSVVQAVGAQILGPPIYGLVYMKTVATYPRTIFFVAVGGFIISFLMIAFVRLPKDAELRHEILTAYSERTHTDIEEEEVHEREH